MAISCQKQNENEGRVTSDLAIRKTTSWSSFLVRDDARLLLVVCKQVKPFA
jgi:hypothetical protein